MGLRTTRSRTSGLRGLIAEHSLPNGAHRPVQVAPTSSSRQPAYRVEVDVVDFLGISEIIFSSEALLPTAVSGIIAIVKTFEAAAQAGMFSQNPAPTSPSITIVSADVVGLRVGRVWRVAGIQLGSYRVLLNMLDAMHRYSAPLASVTLRSSIVGSPRLGWKDLIAGVLPGTSASLPFECRVEKNLVNSSEPVIRIQFAHRIGDDALHAISPLFAAWDGLVIRGGFVDDPVERDWDMDFDESLAGQQTYLSSPDTIEHLFYEDIGPGVAYAALANMALKLHLTFCEVRSLEIE
jgi:hypothetical protein